MFTNHLHTDNQTYHRIDRFFLHLLDADQSRTVVDRLGCVSVRNQATILLDDVCLHCQSLACLHKCGGTPRVVHFSQ